MGQGDCAAANAFLDRYATHRNALVSRGERWGRTVSIAWPLWREGGMQVGAAVMRQLQREAGMLPLATTSGLQALYQAFPPTTTKSRCCPATAGLRAHVRGAALPPPRAPVEPRPAIDPRAFGEDVAASEGDAVGADQAASGADR